MAERLVQELRAPYVIADRTVVVVASSIGIASARDAQGGAADLVRNADVAMYMAKANGKCGFAVFDPGMHAAMRERHELSVDLQRAVELEQLAPRLPADHRPGRPGATPGSRRSSAGSTRARPDRARPVHRDRRGERLDPADRALGPARGLPRRPVAGARGPRLGSMFFSVNVSAREIQQPGFVEGVRDASASPGSSRPSSSSRSPRPRCSGRPRRRSPPSTPSAALGVRTVIDDFGTGYFSLSHLRQFPVDALKIASEFVQDTDRASKSSALAGAIVAMGRSLDIETVAEGIETARAGGQQD